MSLAKLPAKRRREIARSGMQALIEQGLRHEFDSKSASKAATEKWIKYRADKAAREAAKEELLTDCMKDFSEFNLDGGLEGK